MILTKRELWRSCLDTRLLFQHVDRLRGIFAANLAMIDTSRRFGREEASDPWPLPKEGKRQNAMVDIWGKDKAA